MPLSVVIVTHNHSATIALTVESLLAQSEPPGQIIIVDCASSDGVAWMQKWKDRPGLEVVPLAENRGFTGGNNEGWRRVSPAGDLVLFLNPDVILPPLLLASIHRLMAEERSAEFAAMSVRLMTWDSEAGRPTGEVDSTGIFPSWKGWADRRTPETTADTIEPVPALCGAFFLARTGALRQVLRADGNLWDERYFAYKEDIELSLRLRRAGRRLGLWHGAEAWHARGWKRRRLMPRRLRLASAANEVRLHATYARARLPLSLLKWMGVAFLDL